MNRDFFLGCLVAIALLLLWRKEHKGGTATAQVPAAPGMPAFLSTGGGCPGCSADANAPAYAAAPAAQGEVPSGVIGMVSPSAPPLGGAGTTPADTSYMNQIKLWKPVFPNPARTLIESGSNIAPVGTYTPPASYAPNTSGPTPRAVAVAPTYKEQAFVNRAQSRNLGTGVADVWAIKQTYLIPPSGGGGRGFVV